MPTNRRMRSTLDHHSTAGTTLLRLDASNLSMGRTPTLDPYPLMEQNPHSKATVIPFLLLGFPHSEAQLCC